MKTLINVVIIVSAAGIGLAVGFALRGKPANVAHGTGSNVEMTVGLEHEKLLRGHGTRLHANDDSPLATKLEHDLSMSSGVVRWLYWLDAIEKAVSSDFPRLARLAKENSPALQLLAARWVELDPKHFFNTLAASLKNRQGLPIRELAMMLFVEWPKRDPDAVIAALNGPGDFGTRGDWRRTVATALVETDAERGLRLMSQWHIDNYGPGMGAVAKWAAADPVHAVQFTLENPSGSASRLTLETIGKEWAKTEPARALEFAGTIPGDLGSTFASAVLKSWSGRNLEEAATWLSQADPATRNHLSSALVESWAKQDAGSALTWCESNLTGSSLAQAVGGVLKGAAEKDVVGAAQLVAGMSPSLAREDAALMVAEKWLPRFGSDKPVAPEIIDWLSGLDVDAQRGVLTRFGWQWAGCDPKSLVAFLGSASPEAIPDYAYSTVARNMARKSPTEALEWASQLPPDRSLSVGSEAFTEWQRSQPELAIKWLSDLPASDPRRQSFFQARVQQLAYDVSATEQFAMMSVIDRNAARHIIETMPLPEDRRTTLLAVLKSK